MATEKILNTRIQLKYDTLANWNASTFKLKPGELAVVSVGSMKDGSTHSNAQYPVLFKVGTGNHTFAELPFASALAADVYAWAKASDVVLSDKTIQFKNGDNIVKSIVLNYITENEATNLINTALSNYSTTEQMNAAIKVETDRADAAEKALGERIDAIVTGDNSVAKQIESAIAGLDATESQDAGADGLALSITEVDGKITAISGSIAANTYDAYGSAAAAQSAAAAALSTARTEISAEIDADVKALADGAVTTNATNITNIVNGTTPVAKATDADKLGGVVAANYALKTDAQGYANTAEQNAKDYADDIKDALLGEGIKDTFDTLVEIQNWIEGDGVNATELTEAIAAEAKTRAEEDTKLQNQINALGITDGKVANAATADVANSLSESAKSEVKSVKVDNATHADSATSAGEATKATQDAAGNVINTTYETKVDAAQKLADTKEYADQAEADAVATAKSYTDGREAAIKTAYEAYADQAEADAVNAAKEYANGLAGNYATAAQGAKADTAVQTIIGDTGLKATKTNTEVTVGFDPETVFVFNCGSATELID